MGTMLQLFSTDGARIPAYAAWPQNPLPSEGQGRAKGAIVVLQEIFGLNGHIQAVVNGYAADGYFAIAPATFERISPGVALGYTEADIAQGRTYKAAAEALAELILSDVQAAVDFAAHAAAGHTPAVALTPAQALGPIGAAPGGVQPTVSTCKVGLVGYCWGGLLAWRSAARLRGISAAVPYYGGGMHTELGRTVQCPVMAHLSHNDASLPMDGVAALLAAYPQVQAHVYPAAHGFNCDQRAAWHAPSALLARQRTLAFFVQHLASPD